MMRTFSSASLASKRGNLLELSYIDNDKYLPNVVSEVFSGNNLTKVMESGRNFALREDFPHKEVTGANLGKHVFS